MDMEMEMEKRRANSGRSRGSSSGTYLFGQRLLSCVLCLFVIYWQRRIKWLLQCRVIQETETKRRRALGRWNKSEENR